MEMFHSRKLFAHKGEIMDEQSDFDEIKLHERLG